jgi:phospholipase/lecithinase/hemolysin
VEHANLKEKEMNKFITLILFLCFQFFISVSFAVEFDKIIVFGDSLSDTGNVFKLTTQANKIIPLIPIVPKDPPYFHGRFSNGPVWAENLAGHLNIPMESYAFGGSWAETIFDSGPFSPFNLGIQVDLYLVNSILDINKDQHLFVIWSGANDYIHGRFTIDHKPNYDYAVPNTIKNIKQQIDWLIFYGAKHFLILNLPNLGFTPETISRGAEFSSMETEFSKRHNAQLAEMLKKEKNKNPNVKFFFVDIENFFSDVMINPETYHLKNIKDPCYEGSYTFRLQNEDEPVIDAAKKIKLDIANNASLSIAYQNAKSHARGHKSCTNPNEYLFWDRLHPTSFAHQAIAGIVLQALK